MARSRGGRRDYNTIANATLPRRPGPIKWDYVAFNNYITNNRQLKWQAWREHEDRRRYHPLQAAAPALSFNQGRSRFTLRDRRPMVSNSFNNQIGFTPKPQSLFSQTKAAVAFARPKRVLICLRRAVRRQIMHALGHAGKGGQRPPIKNWTSAISCKG